MRTQIYIIREDTGTKQVLFESERPIEKINKASLHRVSEEIMAPVYVRDLVRDDNGLCKDYVVV